MSHPIRLFFEILGSLTALLLVGFGLLLWRLTAGPDPRAVRHPCDRGGAG